MARLVTNIPQDTLFSLGKHLLDYTSCVLFAYQEEMHFGVGQRNMDNNDYLKPFQWLSLQCKLVFENNEHQCILGVFVKMCCEVLLPSECNRLMKCIKKCRGHIILLFLTSQIF